MTSTSEAAAVAGLHALGFSETEAVLYCELLQSPGTTGYRLAQLTGKSQANTYQALSGLLKKGAVLVDERETRLHHAVPYPELLSRLRQGFETRFDTVARSLAELPTQPQGKSSQQFSTLDQVYDKARAMLREAREVVVFDLYPPHFDALEGALRDAVGREVRAAGGVFLPRQTLDDAKVYLVANAERLLANTVGHLLILVTDAEQVLMASTDKASGEILHAFWSDHPLLCPYFHQGVISDLVLEATNWQDSANRFMFGKFPPGMRNYYRET